MNTLSKARTSLTPATGAKTNRFGCNSWIIVSRETGKAVLETCHATVVDKVNTAKYEVLTAYEWLVRFIKKYFKTEPYAEKDGRTFFLVEV